MPPADEPAAALLEAIAAFDAGNHAWGRYRHFVLSAAPEASGVSTSAVREALGEAAICVPDAQTDGPGPLLAAIRSAAAALGAYRAALPAGVPLTELDLALDDFDEAIALLEGMIRG